MFSFRSNAGNGYSLGKTDMLGQIAAINRSQAVIEFSLDGKILHANENFLNAVGYTLDEIKGRHHSIFVDPADRESAEYRAFWEKLGRGEFDSGQYKRIGKGGAEIWIQASYNPILDMSGRPMKVVKYASDITELRAIATQIGDVAREKDLTRKIPMEGKAGVTRLLSEGFNELLDAIGTVIGGIKAASAEVSNAAAEISTSTTR